MTSPTATAPVPGTNLTVHFDPESYAGAQVYATEPGQRWFETEPIGSLGAMVGHGALAHVGRPEWPGYVKSENVTAWRVAHITKAEMAVWLVLAHLGDADALSVATWAQGSVTV